MLNLACETRRHLGRNNLDLSTGAMLAYRPWLARALKAVRREASGDREQRGWVRRVEEKVRNGVARFRDVQRQSADVSSVTGWTEFALVTNANGSVYKPQSLFMEGVK